MSAQTFRLYEVDAKGGMNAGVEIVFDSALEAVDYAVRQRADNRQIELWASRELIARLRARPKAELR